MPIFVTPGQLERRAAFFRALASLLHAGVALLQAVEILERKPPAAEFTDTLARLRAGLAHGRTFSESIEGACPWLTAFDLALVRAGEQSGRLVEALRLVGGSYAERAGLFRCVAGALAYPLFLLHAAALIFPVRFLVALVWEGRVILFLLQKVAVFLPLYGVVLLVAFLCQGTHGENWRATVERALGRVPMLGRARRELALARLAGALEALLNAGVSILHAWPLAAEASGSPALRRAVAGWGAQLDSGHTPGEALSRCPEFPELFANLYYAGEVSGQLDDTLRRLHAHYQEEGARALRNFASRSAHGVHLIILLAIAWQIISFWLGYFNAIGDAMKY